MPSDETVNRHCLSFRTETGAGLEPLWTYQTLNPSALKHRRWASIHFPHASSPCSTMHSSLSLFVSGQAQHIFFFGFVSPAGACPVFSSATGVTVVADVLFPISEINHNGTTSVSKRGRKTSSLINRGLSHEGFRTLNLQVFFGDTHFSLPGYRKAYT